MRILVAEDQPELRRMLVKNLTAAGYTVDGVPDGEEALAYLDAADYDVAVLDIMMPKVDGLTVLRTLRGRDGQLPVLLLTARDAVFDRLERSFKAETQFTSDASHELRTPVTVILAECDTLERTQPTAEDYQEGVGVIRRQAQQMSRLIGQLLHITRLEQGTQKTYMERADLSALAEAVCEQQRLIAPAGTELTLDAPEPVEVQADVLLMTRVLNNLIANAFRYGKDGGHVSVTVRRENGWAVLAVRDDGIGIAPEQQERIWQRFYQVDPARSGGEGTGLGLYMVRQIARLHGGTAEVDSAPGQGSTFTVRIPAHRK